MTPRIYGHINPYGLFLLDMRARLPIESDIQNSGLEVYFAAGGSNVGFAPN